MPQHDMAHRVVLACDCDAFFCQVEQLRNPSLKGKPLAVQQHQDIIAANHEAKQAGIKKHMLPREARNILSKVGGHVVHVFCEDGFRVSYRPYRETSAALVRLLKLCPQAAVVEKASIDEAYVLMKGSDEEGSVEAALQRGIDLAECIRAQVKKELGITLSVGVSINKLLAKLGTRPAKPDGVMAVAPLPLWARLSPAAQRQCMSSQQLLDSLEIDRLPGMGGRIASLLAQAGLTTCSSVASLLATNPQALQDLGVPAAKASLLAQMLRGDDPSEVVDKGPPKSFRVQMTLTPVPLPAHHLRPGELPIGQLSVGPGTAAGDGKGPPQPVVLQPLPVQGPDTRARLSQVLHHMCRDLVSRIVLDRHEEGRWPRRLRVQLHAQAAGSHTSQNMMRSAVFPSAALLDQAPAPAPMPLTAQVPQQGQPGLPPAPLQPGLPQAAVSHERPMVQSGSSAMPQVDIAPAAAGKSALQHSERSFDPLAGAASPCKRRNADVGGHDAMQGACDASAGMAMEGRHVHGGGSDGTREAACDAMDEDLMGARERLAGGGNEGVAAMLHGVHGVADSLAQAVVQQFAPSWVVVQVAVEAGGMVPVEQASAPTITRFLVPTGERHPSSASTHGGNDSSHTGQQTLPPQQQNQQQQTSVPAASRQHQQQQQQQLPAAPLQQQQRWQQQQQRLPTAAKRTPTGTLRAQPPVKQQALPSTYLTAARPAAAASSSLVHQTGQAAEVYTRQLRLTEVFAALAQPFTGQEPTPQRVPSASVLVWREPNHDEVADKLKRRLQTMLRQQSSGFLLIRD